MREGEQILIILLATHTFFFQNKVSRTKIIKLILKACIICRIRWKKRMAEELNRRNWIMLNCNIV